MNCQQFKKNFKKGTYPEVQTKQKISLCTISLKWNMAWGVPGTPAGNTKQGCNETKENWIGISLTSIFK